MRKKAWALAGAAAGVVTVTVTGGVVVLAGTNNPSAATKGTANATKVVRGNVLSVVSLDGVLTYRARSDGSPFSVINEARGSYTQLPDVGDKVGCGTVLYRVDDRPVLLLCGAIPAYRDLHQADVGNDVRQLNQNLHTLGYDVGADIDPTDDVFTAKTQQALEALQRNKGLMVNGALGVGDAVFQPDAVRIAKVTGELGGSAQPGAPVMSATGDTLEVQVRLEASQQDEVHPGDRVHVTLPSRRSVIGKVDRLGRAAQSSAGQNNNSTPGNNAGDATIPAYITLDDPLKAGELDSAPVQVDITTKGVDSVLSVPVTAIVGKSGGGFAVDSVSNSGQQKLIAVELGLFDTTSGRVQIQGDIREGDQVVLPSS